MTNLNNDRTLFEVVNAGTVNSARDFLSPHVRVLERTTNDPSYCNPVRDISKVLPQVYSYDRWKKKRE